jgi:addiction module HigA family antidote
MNWSVLFTVLPTEQNESSWQFTWQPGSTTSACRQPIDLRNCEETWTDFIPSESTINGGSYSVGLTETLTGYGSSIIIEADMAKNQYAPVTPGDMLKHEFLAEYGLSQNELAHAIGVSPNRVAEIVNNRRRITADTAVRLALFFGNSAEFWMNLQSWYDLKMAAKDLSPAQRRKIIAARAA